MVRMSLRDETTTVIPIETSAPQDDHQPDRSFQSVVAFMFRTDAGLGREICLDTYEAR